MAKKSDKKLNDYLKLLRKADEEYSPFGDLITRFSIPESKKAYNAAFKAFHKELKKDVKLLKDTLAANEALLAATPPSYEDVIGTAE